MKFVRGNTRCQMACFFIRFLRDGAYRAVPFLIFRFILPLH